MSGRDNLVRKSRQTRVRLRFKARGAAYSRFNDNWKSRPTRCTEISSSPIALDAVCLAGSRPETYREPRGVAILTPAGILILPRKT